MTTVFHPKPQRPEKKELWPWPKFALEAFNLSFGPCSYQENFQKAFVTIQVAGLEKWVASQTSKTKPPNKRHKLITGITRMIMIAINGHNLTMWLFYQNLFVLSSNTMTNNGLHHAISYFFSQISTNDCIHPQNPATKTQFFFPYFGQLLTPLPLAKSNKYKYIYI